MFPAERSLAGIKIIAIPAPDGASADSNQPTRLDRFSFFAKKASLPHVDSIHAHPFRETKGGSAATIVSDRARHSSINREQTPAKPLKRGHDEPRRWSTALKTMEKGT